MRVRVIPRRGNAESLEDLVRCEQKCSFSLVDVLQSLPSQPMDWKVLVR